MTMRGTIGVSGAHWLMTVFAVSTAFCPWCLARPPVTATVTATTSEPAARVLPISLMQSVVLALQNNLDLKVERLSPLIREEEVRREAGAFFSPRMGVDVSTDRTLRAAGSVLAGAQVLETENLDVNTGVS